MVDLYIIGTGIHGISQMTMGARETLQNCRKIFHLTHIHEELQALCDDVVYNGDLYWTGKPAWDAYHTIIERVVDEVLKGPGVANLTYGHPLFFDDINMGLVREMKNRGLTYKVLPGVSCLDTISSDLEIDYGDGLQVYEIQTAVRHNTPLNPNIHTLLLQIAQFGSNLTLRELPYQEGRFTPLEDYLRQFYPDDHPASIIFSDRGDSYDQFQLDLTISNFDEHQEKIFKGTTLYIPPVTIQR